MKTQYWFILTFAFTLLTGCNSEESTGFFSHDRAHHIKDGWIRDPYIYLHEGTYYLTGTTPQYNDPRLETEPYNIGLDAWDQRLYGRPSIVGYSINVWSSDNLKDWDYVGAPFSLEDGYWKEVFPAAFDTIPKSDWRLWAPEVYQIDGDWVFIHTSPAPVQAGANLAVGNLEGTKNFSFPMQNDMRSKHDPSLFRDDDGTWYLLWGNTWIAPIKEGFTGLAAEPVRIDPSNRVIGHEGATLRKIGDKYVHFGTAWSTDQPRKGSYNLYYCTSDNITGPYNERKFVGRFLGHGTPFVDMDGQWWCTAFFNANVLPVSDEGIQSRDLREDAQTINEQGTTIVPLEVKILPDGEIFIRAKDPRYRNPGPDEVQQFTSQ